MSIEYPTHFEYDYNKLHVLIRQAQASLHYQSNQKLFNGSKCYTNSESIKYSHIRNASDLSHITRKELPPKVHPNKNTFKPISNRKSNKFSSKKGSIYNCLSLKTSICENIPPLTEVISAKNIMVTKSSTKNKTNFFGSYLSQQPSLEEIKNDTLSMKYDKFEMQDQAILKVPSEVFINYDKLHQFSNAVASTDYTTEHTTPSRCKKSKKDSPQPVRVNYTRLSGLNLPMDVDTSYCYKYIGRMIYHKAAKKLVKHRGDNEVILPEDID